MSTIGRYLIGLVYFGQFYPVLSSESSFVGMEWLVFLGARPPAAILFESASENCSPKNAVTASLKKPFH